VTFSPDFPGLDAPVRTPRAWFAQFRPRPVTLSSPYPPAECGRRLEQVTVSNQFDRYLGSRAGLPAPRLLGQVSPARVRVARLESSGRRNSTRPWFDGRIEQSPEGGTILRGTVVPSPDSLPVFLVISAVWCLILPIMLAVGIGSLVAGHRGQALPFVLIPCAMLAVYAIVVALTPGQIRSQATWLLDELGEILGSQRQ
jgi:hypothetical protein